MFKHNTSLHHTLPPTHLMSATFSPFQPPALSKETPKSIPWSHRCQLLQITHFLPRGSKTLSKVQLSKHGKLRPVLRSLGILPAAGQHAAHGSALTGLSSSHPGNYNLMPWERIW